MLKGVKGTGCRKCVNKTEAKLYEKIITIYPSLQTQFKQEWCKRIKHLPYDFCIPEYKIIIELDGVQHFTQIMNWSSPEEQFENDKFKEECANQNGYSVIRLLQEDVFYDTYDWVKELCDEIEEVKSSEVITNVYLCKNGEYEQF
jgi:very-short-patch-repair endonuclease